MCGIVYSASFRDQPVNNAILNQFYNQRTRGIEGFGVFDGQFKNIIRTPHEYKIIDWLKRYPSRELLFHHRMPTSTDNVKNACHPFSTYKFFKTNYILVHNGWINNASEMYEKHRKLGIVYASEQADGRFNDSEALLWEFALYKEGKQKNIEARGPVAFICIALNGKNDKLYFARNTNPLKIHRSKKNILLSSEGEGVLIPAYILHTFDYKTKEVTKQDIELPQAYYTSDYKYEPGYEHGYSSGLGYAGGHTGGWYDQEGKLHAWGNVDDDDELAEVQSVMEYEDDFEAETTEIYYEYLERAEGFFEDMFYLLQKDIDIALKLESTDPDAKQERFRLEAVIDRLVDTKSWNATNAIHPAYIKDNNVNKLIGSMYHG